VNIGHILHFRSTAFEWKKSPQFQTGIRPMDISMIEKQHRCLEYFLNEGKELNDIRRCLGNHYGNEMVRRTSLCVSTIDIHESQTNFSNSSSPRNRLAVNFIASSDPSLRNSQ
jgi:hypothetical protein